MSSLLPPRRVDAVLDGRAFPPLMLLGVILRLAAILGFPVFPLVGNTEDTAIYDAGARSLAAGLGYQWGGHPTAFFPIGWPLILSLAYRIGGVSALSGQLVNFLFGLVIVGGGWLLGRRLLGARSGRFIALVLMLLPHQVIYPAFLMSETAFTAFFVSSLAILAALPGLPSIPPLASVWRLIGAGVLMGVATLVRGPALVYPIVAGAWAHLGLKARPVELVPGQEDRFPGAVEGRRPLLSARGCPAAECGSRPSRISPWSSRRISTAPCPTRRIFRARPS